MNNISFQLFNVDDGMYVAGTSIDQVRAYVHAECGQDCAESIEEASLEMRVTTANVDDGEKVTPESMTTARALIEEHLKCGGSLPYTVCFDAGM